MRSRDRGPKCTLYWHGEPYAVNIELIPMNTVDFDKPVVCPHCDRKLKVTTELIAYGETHDKHTYTFLCLTCLIGYMYNHIIQLEETVE